MAIIETIQLILYMFEWVSGFSNPVCYCCVCCAQLLLSCIKGIVEQISSAVYALCGLEGRSFCGCAFTAYALCKTHATRFAVLASMATMVEYLGIFLTAGAGSMAAYYWLHSDLVNLQSIIYPLVACIILCYLLACTMMSLIVAISEALFFSFIADEVIAKSKGGESEFTPEALKTMLDSPEKISGKKDDEAAGDAPPPAEEPKEEAQ